MGGTSRIKKHRKCSNVDTECKPIDQLANLALNGHGARGSYWSHQDPKVAHALLRLPRNHTTISINKALIHEPK